MAFRGIIRRMTGENLDDTQPNTPPEPEGENNPEGSNNLEGKNNLEGIKNLEGKSARGGKEFHEADTLPNPPVTPETVDPQALTEPMQPVAANEQLAPPGAEDLEATLPHQPAVSEMSDGETVRSAALASPPDSDAPTSANFASSGEPPSPKAVQPAGKKRGPGMLLLFFMGILLLIVVAALSIYSGYQSGIAERQSAELTQTASDLEEQYTLAMQDLAGERYEVARQRLDYILKINPSYPGVIDGITQAELALNVTATPTVMPTPTLTPTPDTRGVDTLYEQAQQALTASDWTTAIDNLLSLRKADPSYHSVDIDGMLYLALRNRGVDKILKEGDLEGGTYDLALAERFGPLDAEASSYRIWVNLYVTGASFWEIDWGQAVYYFSQVAPNLPGLRDASGWTASQRYAIALTRYADTVAASDDWCQAQELYDSALAAGADPAVQDLADQAAKRCNEGNNGGENNNGNNNPEPTAEQSTPEPLPTEGEQPTVEPQPTEGQPTAEPSPTEGQPTPLP
jgi:tetratricopeptide (TPR) repeat protein